jgi:selenocysteine lyase/cysteine desulfurase
MIAADSQRALQASLEAKRFPHHVDDSAFFEVPNRLRASIARLIGSKPEEVGLTTGASTGLAAVAHGLIWKPGDEIITAKGEFPVQYATGKPDAARASCLPKSL